MKDVVQTALAIVLSMTALATFSQVGAQQPVRPRVADPQAGRTGARIENGAALENFFRALAATRSGQRLEPVRIMHFGDSHTAADILTAEIRRNFQRDFGDGGAGYMVPRNPMSTPRRGVVSGTSSGWIINGIKGQTESDGIYGPAGFSLSTNRPNERIWLETSCNHFEVYYLRQPGGGSIDISVDGVSVLDEPIFLMANAPTPDYRTFDTPLDTEHRIEIRTLNSGKTRILGIVSEHITPGAGVSYDVLGINGARATRLLSWNDKALANNLKQRKPDLIIVAYGTNEVTDDNWTIGSYQRQLAGIIRRLRQGAPDASVLVYGPPDRGDVELASKKMPEMVEAQRRAALEAGAAFWSSYQAMGGPGSMKAWAEQGLAQGDFVHLSSAGYFKMGDMFYQDMMQAYDKVMANVSRAPRKNLP